MYCLLGFAERRELMYPEFELKCSAMVVWVEVFYLMMVKQIYVSSIFEV